MIALIITIVVFLLLILLVIWGHFIHSGQTSFRHIVKNRDETNVRLYHEHKAEIEKDFKEEAIDEESYQYLLAELEKALLQDIEQNADEQKDIQPVTKGLSPWWPALLTLFVFGFSFTFYLKTGAYEELGTNVQAMAQASGTQGSKSEGHQGLTQEQQVMVHIQQLQKKLEQEPNNTELWYEFGQTLVGAGDFDNAISAFDRIIEIEGEHADLVGAKAQALYYKNNQVITEEVQSLIDRALTLNPTDPSTNILLGMHNFIGQHYQVAINHWQKVIDANSASVNVAALQEAIDEAKNRLSLTGGEMENGEMAEQAPTTIEGPQLSLVVSLSDDIMEKLSQGEDKVVFVYATPTDGRRMPLAAVKIKASDLPITIILNNAKAMSPQANLSSVKAVHLYAVISSSGGVGIKSGDYKAEQLNVLVSTTDEINLIINTIVP